MKRAKNYSHEARADESDDCLDQARAQVAVGVENEPKWWALTLSRKVMTCKSLLL